MQDNVALIVVLDSLEGPDPDASVGKRQLVCVANTHIHANPELKDVKLWQVCHKCKPATQTIGIVDHPLPEKLWSLRKIQIWKSPLTQSWISCKGKMSKAASEVGASEGASKLSETVQRDSQLVTYQLSETGLDAASRKCPVSKKNWTFYVDKADFRLGSSPAIWPASLSHIVGFHAGAYVAKGAGEDRRQC
jgi:hypothetical protein